MSQCDCVLISVARVQKARNESEDLGRDLIDWGKLVPPGQGLTDGFKVILLRSMDLKGGTRKRPPIHIFRLSA